jgi:hypothetical protein
MAGPTLMKMISPFRQFGAPRRELVEPSWDEVLVSPDERQSATGYWREVIAALRANGTLEPVRNHAVLRLVVAYIVCDRASAAVMRSGAPVDVQAWSVHLAASQLAGQIEGDLGLSPRRGAT